MDARQKWKWIKRIRCDYRPWPVSIHNTQAKPVSQTKQAQTFAQQTINGSTQGRGTQAHVNHSSTRRKWTQAPLVEELDAALLKASRNKAAGVDDIPTEAWQWLTADNRRKLLDILNQALTAGHIPQEWRQALVVEITRAKVLWRTQTTTAPSAC